MPFVVLKVVWVFGWEDSMREINIGFTQIPKLGKHCIIVI